MSTTLRKILRLVLFVLRLRYHLVFLWYMWYMWFMDIEPCVIKRVKASLLIHLKSLLYLSFTVFDLARN